MATNKDIIGFYKDGYSDNAIVKKLVDSDSISQEKAFMVKAESYYVGQNDVLNIDFRKYKINGIERVNENRSNQRISHNYLKLLVNQAANYIAGNPITYKVDDENFQTFLDEFLMFDFDDNNINWIKEARKKGRSYCHFYYDEAGELNYAIIPSEQIIPIYSDEFKKDLKQVIRYYKLVGTDDKGNKIVRTKAEWWNESEVKIFITDDKGDFMANDIVPHWSSSISTKPDMVEAHGWGKVPFVQLFNNEEASSDLQDIKQFIDAIDILESEFVNQIADVREILIKVMGYSGSSADEILTAFRGTGIVKIDSPDGDIDILKSEIPVEARQAALKNLRESIFSIGQGVDTNPERIGTSISGIALKMLYGALDLKCSSTIRKMSKSLYEFLWFTTDHYNRTFNASINYRDIKLTFNKNLIVNEAEIIDSLAKSKGIISDETIIERHPYVENPTLEVERLEKQEEKQMEQFNQQLIQEQKPQDVNKDNKGEV